MAFFDFLNPLGNNVLRFTDEQVNDILEWFDNNAKPHLIINEGEPVNVITINNLMNFYNLKKFHRRSYKYPSYAEIMNEAEKLKAGLTKMLTKEQFLYVLDKFVVEPDLKHELKLAFKVFDTEKRDFLDLEDIKMIVGTYADVYNETECREILRDANVRGDGNVYYEDFVESLFNVAPELYQIKAEYLYDDPDEDPSVPPEPIIEQPEIVEPPPPPPPPPAKKKGKKK